MSRLRLFSLVIAGAIAASLAQSVRAEKTAADLLPPSSLGYVQINDPKELVPLLLDHPLRKDIEQSSAFRQATTSPQFKKMRELVREIERRTGLQWRTALEQTAGEEVVIAFEPLTQGAVLLIKPRDVKAAGAVRDALISMARDDAAAHGKPDPVEVKAYRDLKAYHLGEAIVADLGPWVMVCNKKRLAQRVADTFLDGGDSLAADEQFSAAQRLSAGEGAAPSAWAFVRVAPLRLFAKPPWLDPKYKSDNPAAEFILGGLIPITQNAPYVTASLWLDRDGVKLSAAAPYDESWVPADQKFFFAAGGDGAGKPLMPADTLLSITTYRDLAAMWQAGPDLFTEAVATQMAQTDSGLSTILGGKSFSADVLGAFKPQMQLVVARQDFDPARQKPSLRLPGAALVFEIKPDRFHAVRKQFRVGFQSAVALANLDGAQKGRALLEMQTETRGKSEIQYAVYSPDEPAKDDKSPHPPKEDAYLNFSPAMAMSERHLIISSTRQLVEQLADLDARDDSTQTIADNSLVQTNPKLVSELIRANREQLVAQNMLEKGHTRVAAEKEIDLLQAIVGYFSDARLRLVSGQRSIRLEAQVKVAQPATTR
jgi:hypothetical protein